MCERGGVGNPVAPTAVCHVVKVLTRLSAGLVGRDHGCITSVLQHHSVVRVVLMGTVLHAGVLCVHPQADVRALCRSGLPHRSLRNRQERASVCACCTLEVLLEHILRAAVEYASTEESGGAGGSLSQLQPLLAVCSPV